MVFYRNPDIPKCDYKRDGPGRPFEEGPEGIKLLRKPYSAIQLSTALPQRIMRATEQQE